jgi:hypothetical protein
MDIKIQDILAKEVARQENTIELIASENFASQSVMDLAGMRGNNEGGDRRSEMTTAQTRMKWTV